MSTAEATPKPAIPDDSVFERIRANISAGNLGSWPVVIGLILIVLFFSIKADNFFTAPNFTNIITQMAGVTMLAYGVVFVLLIGEIDLSISYVAGVGGVVVAQMTIVGSSQEVPGWLAIIVAVAACALIGAFQGSIVALVGVPAFVVTLAGYQIWQGVIQKSIPQGVIVIQNNTVNDVANYFFSKRAGWIMAFLIAGFYLASTLTGVIQRRRHGIAVRDPWLLGFRTAAIIITTFVVVAICNKDRGVPFVLLMIVGFMIFWTFIAKRTTFGRHVYAVGGNAEGARRAGINVARVRIIVFMISSGMAGVGGIVLAARLNSVDLNAGGGTLLIDAIAAAVIGGTSLFGGRGNAWSALLGIIVIQSISNGLTLLNLSSSLRYMITGAVLAIAVIVDSLARKSRVSHGRA